ncbi:UDP-N-acetylmuramate dehydrogenase [Lipingzhangella sp. LS1_29]|uniref:UDP-N-acetylenolpyruvoylglucosamine reductase n=1 Tax=Lipingzhangella rawalii TaxID=2055835 RepID=A0ABU2H3U5_9ACTN|nr:UDP-N-acetylmuramate dehydrogenase [Lipingzhangella rawalii]MDS1269976.1 UDP-N-acetylmuramate dehydrogenase [Lipingzhangella rawalii]
MSSPLPAPPGRHSLRLAEHTTLGLGGPAKSLVRVSEQAELVEAVRAADRAAEPLLLLGGGSNLVVSDAGFPGTVVQVDVRGVSVRTDPMDPDRRYVRVGAGENWTRFVEWSVGEGLSGVECLAGVPGNVGATPIQNVGAYGQEVSQTITEVVVYDRHEDRMRTLGNADCAFGYRTSALKGTDRYVVCAVVFALHRSPHSQPIAYRELARHLGVDQGDTVELRSAHDAVVDLRRGKGMVLDPEDPDSRSAGSFFTNPILAPNEHTELRKRVYERFGPDIVPPEFPTPDGRTKTSAAWLIDRSGFERGYTRGPVRISTKHTLALTNPGAGTAADLLALAREIRAGVADTFGVTLVNEPVLVGVEL